MNPSERQALVDAAQVARAHAYCPYSHVEVGAAVRTTSGEIFTGCNVENVSFGLTICAERVALTAAVAAGFQQFAAIAIASTGALTPCGACRQFMAEFAVDFSIFLIDANSPDRITEHHLANLLPESFRLTPKSQQ